MNNLDLLPYASQLQRKVEDNDFKVWDPIRRKYYVLTPEEMVRQCIIAFLIQKSHFSKNHISVEKGLKTAHKQLRFDLLVYDQESQPFLLIECKAPSVPLTQLTFDQIAHYNTILMVPYLWISNGHDNRLCQISWEEKKFTFLEEFPFYK